MLDGRHEMDSVLPELLKLALVEYRLRTKSKAREPWSAVPRTSYRTPSRRLRNDPNCDIYCVFCGERILTDVTRTVTTVLRSAPFPRGVYLVDTVIRHTTICALQSLAGLRVPVAPGTRRIPEALRDEEQRA